MVSASWTNLTEAAVDLDETISNWDPALKGK